jgi:hypothetical protein
MSYVHDIGILSPQKLSRKLDDKPLLCHSAWEIFRMENVVEFLDTLLHF